MNVYSTLTPLLKTTDSKLNITQNAQLEKFTQNIITEILSVLKTLTDTTPLFDGISFENYDSLPHLSLLAPIASYFHSRGVLCFLTLSSPSLESSTLPNLKNFNGLFLQNVTLTKEGTSKDYFEMVPHLHNIVKLYTDQVTYRQDFVCFIEERLNDKGKSILTPAKVNRFLRISQFYKFVPWISTDDCIMDVGKIGCLIRPMNAVEIINRSDYKILKNAWGKHQVDTQISPDPRLFERFEKCFPNLNALFPQNRVNINTIQPTHERKYKTIENYAMYSFEQSLAVGRFDYGALPSHSDSDFLIHTQQTLLSRKLLLPIEESILKEVIKSLHSFQSKITSSLHDTISMNLSSHVTLLIKKLLVGTIKVYQSLDSSFWINDTHFWSIYAHDNEPNISQIYISLKHPSVVEAILGAFLSYQGLDQKECMMAESILNNGNLPLIILQQLDTSTPFELLTITHESQLEGDFIDVLVKVACKERLIDDVNIQQLMYAHSIDLVVGKISIQAFLKMRIKWYSSMSVTDIPDYDLDALAGLYEDMNTFIDSALLYPQYPDPIQTVLDFLNGAYSKKFKIDTTTGKI